MSDVMSSPAIEPEIYLDQLLTGSEKVQLPLIKELGSLGSLGCQVLADFLTQRSAVTPIWVAGQAYEMLLKSGDGAAQQFVLKHYPDGVVPLTSSVGVNYAELQQQLARQEFQVADTLTLAKLCELANPAAVKRKWPYFSEIDLLPVVDLHTIDQLWLAHSEGKFGYSVQRQLWLSAGKNWDLFWPKIGWRDGKAWTRYPGGFTWDLSAPRGHLPLSNQLRGVQTMNALLNHSAWAH
jgi:membrane-bound metal-dependent hydrolase YbcI (DUF457 family)